MPICSANQIIYRTDFLNRILSKKKSEREVVSGRLKIKEKRECALTDVFDINNNNYAQQVIEMHLFEQPYVKKW